MLVFSSGLMPIFGQVEDSSKVVLRERALERFENGEFDDALFDYRILMNKFSRDPMYKYYCGACMVELNMDYEDAVEMLHFSSTRGVPKDVYYYLGEAYRKMYDFQKAKQYYLRFDKEASRALTKKKNSKLLIRSVNEAARITTEYNPFDVINVTSMNLYDPAQYSQIRMKGGILQEKPKEFYSEGEESGDLNSLMFLPEKVERGTYVYFTGYEKSGKNGTQIFHAKKGNTGKWTDIKPVQEINTELDEILPYYDPVGKDMYFASNGFEGIGGFDLYRSHFDEERKEWSLPINLGFPINSAFDDYLLLPGRDLGMVMFFTGRNGADSATTVYRVHFSEPKVSLASESPEEVRRIANLGSVAAKMLGEIALTQKASVQKKEVKNVKPVPKDNKVSTEIKIISSNVDTEYQSMVAAALTYQTVSDSLAELSTSAMIKVRESEDPNDRWLYQKQILVWEKKAGAEQQLADELYAKIADYKPHKKENIPESIEKDTVISNITVYRFKEDENKEAVGSRKDVFENKAETKKLVEKPADIKPEPMKKPVSKTNIPLNRFKLLDESPYSPDNPIPVDLELPKGSFYRIQIGAFSKTVAPNAFEGLSPITAETIPERNLTKYYVGKFSRYEDAVKARQVVRSSGYETAYIVSWYNGSTMSLEKVRKLEK